MVWEVRALGLEVLPKQRTLNTNEAETDWGKLEQLGEGKAEQCQIRGTLECIMFQGNFTLGTCVTQTHYVSVLGILQTIAHGWVLQKNSDLRPTQERSFLLT